MITALVVLASVNRVVRPRPNTGGTDPQGNAEGLPHLLSPHAHAIGKRTFLIFPEQKGSAEKRHRPLRRAPTSAPPWRSTHASMRG